RRARQQRRHSARGATLDLRAIPARPCSARKRRTGRRPRPGVRTCDRARSSRQARLRIEAGRDVVSDPVEAPPRTDRRASPGARFQRPRFGRTLTMILIVEDDEAIATGLALNLKLASRQTSIARDGDDAIAQATHTDFSLVLLDINLP